MEGESTLGVLSGFVLGALTFQHLNTDSDTVSELGSRLSSPPPLPAAPAGRAGSRTGAPSLTLIRALPTWSSLGVQFLAASGWAREILPLSALTTDYFVGDPRAVPCRRSAARTGRTATAASRRGLAGPGSGAQGGCPNAS